MKVIAFFGDSHTWGQGVGAEYGMKVCGGDLRMLSFENPSYVNLVRMAYALKTDSGTEEYYGKKLIGLCDASEDDMGVLNGSELHIRERFAICRIFCCASQTDNEVKISVDGDETVFTLKAEEPIHNKDIKTFVLHAEDGFHTLGITAADRFKIHRIEFYFGEYAIVNCGVGSCPVSKYLSVYYDDYIRALHPYGVVFEGCTINNWLTFETKEEYGREICDAIDRMTADGIRILGHTVFPIGSAENVMDVPWVNTEGITVSDDYSDYVDAMKEVFKGKQIPCVDCNASMKAMLSEIPEEKRTKFLYHDAWHPNTTGHFVYAKMLTEKMFAYFM